MRAGAPGDALPCPTSRNPFPAFLSLRQRPQRSARYRDMRPCMRLTGVIDAGGRRIQAQREFDTLLDVVERGEEIMVVRDGRAIARLQPVIKDFDREKARQAVERIIEASRGVTLGGL